MDLAPWGQRLQQQSSSIDVLGAADLESAMRTAPKRTPAVFLVVQGGSAAPNTRGTGGHRQQVTERFGAAICVKNVADPKGHAAQQATEPVRALVDQAFLAWTPDANEFDPAEFVRGELIGYRDGYLWWLDVYQTRFYKTRP